jgi:arsenate reductase
LKFCGGDSKACPFFSGGKTYLHESFEDPAKVVGTEQIKLMLQKN